MFSRSEHREKLKQEAKNQLFDQQFDLEVQRQLAEKQSNSGKSLSEKMGKDLFPTHTGSEEKRFAIAGDDDNKTLMWRSLMKDCAFYYDVPRIEEETAMKKTLQRKYDNLFEDGWRPALTSRRDLVTWACNSYNKSLVARDVEAERHVDCENYAGLLMEFGPDYDRLRPKLGHVRGLFD